MKPGLIYGIAFIVTILLIVIINKKLKSQEKPKKTNIEKKQEEVESLRLDVEREKLEAQLKEMKEPSIKYCDYCGAENDKKSHKCTECGVVFKNNK